MGNLDVVAKKSITFPARNQTLAVRPMAIHFTDKVIQAHEGTGG
jgi:hypothetical protein